jgi:MbtH protein
MNDEEPRAATSECLVLINDEEQYCVWPAQQVIPGGWRAVGPRGSLEECTAWVEDNWTDMRPKSLRLALGSC